MFNHYRLTSETHTVNAKINGDDWAVEVIAHANGPDSMPWQVCYRYISITHNTPDNGMIYVSRALRKEFGITGIYTPIEG